MYFCTEFEKNAQMAELVDALVSNTSAARHAGSIPALGTRSALEAMSFQGAFFLCSCGGRTGWWALKIYKIYKLWVSFKKNN